MVCMPIETGLLVAKPDPPNRASNTGAVIRCWLSIDTASSVVIESFRLPCNPVRKSSKVAFTWGPEAARIALMRATWASCIRATSPAQRSQYSQLPTLVTMRE